MVLDSYKPSAAISFEPYATHIVNAAVLMVLLARRMSKIGPTVVVSLAVDVVDFIRRISSFHEDERQTMRLIFPLVDLDQPVSERTHASSAPSRFGAAASASEPMKIAGIRAVRKQGLKVFLVHAPLYQVGHVAIQ